MEKQNNGEVVIVLCEDKSQLTQSIGTNGGNINAIALKKNEKILFLLTEILIMSHALQNLRKYFVIIAETRSVKCGIWNIWLIG